MVESIVGTPSRGFMSRILKILDSRLKILYSVK